MLNESVVKAWFSSYTCQLSLKLAYHLTNGMYGYKEVQLKKADLATSYAMLRTTTADSDYVCIHMCK